MHFFSYLEYSITGKDPLQEMRENLSNFEYHQTGKKILLQRDSVIIFSQKFPLPNVFLL